MADATGDGRTVSADEARVEQLATKLMRESTDNGSGVTDLETARVMARRILEDSDARTRDPATRDPENEGIIRRESEESAASGGD